MYSNYIKRHFDFLVAWILLIILGPLWFLISLSLFLSQGKTILFFQERTGKNGIRFRLIKFRTLMSTHSPDLSLENRKFTPLGRFLRKTGLDELPQLVNIIKGHMSFVGPRPMPIKYESKYSDQQLDRFTVKPGLTGYAQINGRNNISWKTRFKMDSWYVKNQSFRLDLKIFLITVFQFSSQLLFSKEQDRNMPVFNGSN